MIERIGVEELLRRLYEGDALVAEIAQRPIEEARSSNVVGIEERDKITVREGQCMIEIPRFGIAVFCARLIAAADFLGESANLSALAVVEDPGLVRIFDA